VDKSSAKNPPGQITDAIGTFLESLTSYFHSKEEILAAYIFGSYAVGRPNPQSDLDIAILAPPFKNRMESFNARVRYQTEISKLIRKDVDVVLLREAGESLSYQILKHGRLIYEKEASAHRSFVARRVIQCLDFQYYERLMQQGMIAAMKREHHGQ
jgi:predicted nucleotidyltransferase